jgi:hypothetical protein
MSEYLFPGAVVVAAAAADVMVILLPLMVTTVMGEQHDNYYFEAATMLPIRQYQLLGSASCRSLFNGGLASLRLAAFCFPYLFPSLFLFFLLSKGSFFWFLCY